MLLLPQVSCAPHQLASADPPAVFGVRVATALAAAAVATQSKEPLVGCMLLALVKQQQQQYNGCQPVLLPP